MQFPDRHPELVLYARLATVLIVLGAAWSMVGLLAGRHATVSTENLPLAPWQLAWWASFGWGYGIALIVAGIGVFALRAARKRSVLFGDRVRREYR